MQSKAIFHEEGYLGPFPRIVEPRDTHLLTFLHTTLGLSECLMLRKKSLALTHTLEVPLPYSSSKMPESMLELRENRVLEDALPGKHGIQTHKSVSLLLQRN